MQLPVIASRVGGVPEIIKEGETGYLVDNGNDSLWIERIQALLEDRTLSRRLGKNGRNFVERNFSWKVLSPKLLSIFESELSRKSTPTSR